MSAMRTAAYSMHGCKPQFTACRAYSLLMLHVVTWWIILLCVFYVVLICCALSELIPSLHVS